MGGVDDRSSCSSRCSRATEDRRLGRLAVRFTLERRVARRGHLRLLLATACGDEAEHQEGDQGDDQEVHDLEALEAITHEHGRQQATGGEAGEWAQPARSTAGGGRSTARSGRRGGRRGWRSLASLVDRRGARALAAAEALGVGVQAQRQADAERQCDAKKTLHKWDIPCCGLHARHVAQVPRHMTSDIMFRAFA